ncbi:hypothetical protein ACFOG5_09910 [Pedobacter fastidiosus]|uniref:Uncharacterized protein n=1 Tax=Pedobacter fastidiosus TaxID=2765361 RepID=A0ABR7KXV4_9SPHI|nr:hypothetical protein [Pedobacter fastidiosus]
MITAKAQSSDCLRFRIGKFKMIYQGKSLIINRDANHQYEYYDDNKLPIEYKIKWISNCSYTLQPDKTILRFSNISKSALITVKIISYSGNTYKIKATSNFNKQVLESEITKIN